MSDVPPSRQCTLRTCEREAVDPGRGSLCQRHLEETEESATEDGEADDVDHGCEPEDADHNSR